MVPGFPVPWSIARTETTLAQRLDAAALLTRQSESSPPRDIVKGLAGHGLLPLAYRHLIVARDAEIPEAVADEIAAEFRQHVLSRFRHTRRLRELLDALDSAGVDAVPYKGPALAVQLFGNFAMRQYGDLDILVRPSQARAAIDALAAAGLMPVRKAREGWDDYLLRVRHSVELRDRRLKLLVELHWSVADRFLGMDLDVDWLLEHPGEIDLLGRPTKVMQGERLLLAQCLHGAKHLWERAIWLAEIAEIIRQSSDIDWRTAFARANRTGLGRVLRAALILVSDRTGIAPPAPWDRQLDRDLGAIRLAGMLSDRVSAAAPDRLATRFRLGLRAQTTMTGRASFCWRVATDLSDRDIQTADAPSTGVPLMHAVRRTRRLLRVLRAERTRAGEGWP